MTFTESIARSRTLRRPSPSAFSSKSRAWSCVSQFPVRAPSCFAPLTRRIPAASSGLSRPESAASYASRLTAARRLGTIPGDELLHRELVVSPRMRRTEAIEYGGFCVIQIWELQNNFAAGWPFVSFVHMSGLHAADMHKIDPEEAFWPQKVRR